MKRGESNSISDNQALAMIVGTMIGVSVTIAKAVAEKGKQGAWISTIIGAAYPLLLSFLAAYICNKHPEQDILALNELYFGKWMGNVLNIIFFFRFPLFVVLTLSGFYKVISVYATPFLSPIKIYIAMLILIIFTHSRGFKTLTRINEISLIIIIVMTISLSIGLPKGNYLYLIPIIDRNLAGIFKAVQDAVYYYSGIEIIFLIYPYMKNKKSILKVSLRAVFITMATNTFMVIMCIYYLGYKLVNMSLWPVLLMTEFNRIQVINTSRYIFLLLWSFVILKRTANEYYGCGHIIKYMFKLKSYNAFYIISLPVFLFSALSIRTYAQRSSLIKLFYPALAIINLIVIALLALMIFIKNKNK